ncbi:MAG: hypothetical protein JXA81_04050 [Sedimentisphaerales bacterium]|nr:hypothetical protein [Sedimentisphaerales bacterium]
MLKIRKEQNDELAKVALKRFEDDMVIHIKKYFPKYYEIMGEPTVRKVIQYSIEKAETYGFTTERDVCLYINLVFLLGSNFDTDLQIPWAAATLKDETITDSVIRINKIYEIAMDYLDRVNGKNNLYLALALRKIREVPFGEFSNAVLENVDQKVISQLKNIWPEKCQHLGNSISHQLVQRGIESARRYNITGEKGLVLYIGLMFMLGSGFDHDPQFTWTTAVLKNKDLIEQTPKIERLYTESMTFLNKWLT